MPLVEKTPMRSTPAEKYEIRESPYVLRAELSGMVRETGDKRDSVKVAAG